MATSTVTPGAGARRPLGGLLLAALLAVTGHALESRADEYDDYRVLDWQTDLRTVDSEVAQPLHDELRTSPDAEWLEYSTRYNDRLKTIRDRLDPVSYQILQNAVAAMNDEYLSWKNPPDWHHAESYIRNKLDFAHGIIALLNGER